MAFPKFTMKELIEAGCHFGHHTRRWNPKMAPYIFGVKDKIHIINLQKTVPMLHAALIELKNVTANGGKVLFIGTKEQSRDIIAEAAKLCGQFYINTRWLGGMLTNWKTIANSINKLKELEQSIKDADKLGLTKKEISKMESSYKKLISKLATIRNLIKRRLKNVINENIRNYNLQGYDFIFIARSSIINIISGAPFISNTPPKTELSFL